MKIAIIRPSMFGEPSSDRMMPILFSILSSITPSSYKLCFYDERLSSLPENFDEDVVAISVETFAAKRAYQIADACRRSGKKVILGGFHVTTYPGEAEAHADAVLRGDAENTWIMALSDLSSGQLKKAYEGNYSASLSNLSYDYGIFKKGDYKLIAPVQFGRGCKYSCDFCSIHAFYGNSIRYRPVDEVCKNIREIKQKYLFFVDDNIFADENYARELFATIKPLKKKWICQISMDVATNPEILRQMKDSGCIMVLIGFESLNRKNLIAIGKGANLNLDYESVIANIYAAGLMIYGTFIIGYDHDDAYAASKLCDFALKHKFAMANFNPLMPMPGTALYNRLADEGRLPYRKWWLDDEYRYGDAMLIPKLMSGAELNESCKTARFRFNSVSNIMKRATNFKSNFKYLFLFLVASFVSRKEIHNKQGRKLGTSKK